MAGRNFKAVDPEEGKNALPLPHSMETEQQLLGAIFLDNNVFSKVSHFLRGEDFYEEIHQQIYDLIEYMIGKDRAATPITIGRHSGDIKVRDGMNVQQYLSRLAAEGTTSVLALDYAKIVKDDSIKRDLWKQTEKLRQQVLNPAMEAAEILDEHESFISDIRPKSSRAEQFRPFSRAVATAVGNATTAYEKGGVISGLSTGLDGLDQGLGGLNRGDLIILAARPAMGKTALAINMAFTHAKDLRERRLDKVKTGVVAVFSLEMPDHQIANRVISEESKVSSWRVRKGVVDESEIQRFIQAGKNLENLPIQIDHTGALPISQLVTRIRALHRRVGVEMVIVDYLQLLRGSGTGRNREVNRVQEVTEITTSLKAIAKELDVPVVALSQLSRKVEERDDKRPHLADLRESGSIEQDADVVIFIYRDEYYLNKAEPRPGDERHNEWALRMEQARGRAELIIGKNRHGPETTVNVAYDSTLTRFHNDVPDSVANSSVPREKKSRPKALNLSKHATVCFGMLKTLSLVSQIQNDSHIGSIPKGTKLVKYVEWRERCATELLDPGHSEKQAVGLMEKAAPELLAAKLIGRGGDKTDPFVWSIEQK